MRRRYRVVDTPRPELLPGRLFVSRQKPQADLGAAVPEGVPQVNAIAVDHAHDVAVIRRGRSDGPFDHLAINELMGPGRANRDRRHGFFRREAPVRHARRCGICRARLDAPSHAGSVPRLCEPYGLFPEFGVCALLIS